MNESARVCSLYDNPVLSEPICARNVEDVISMTEVMPGCVVLPDENGV